MTERKIDYDRGVIIQTEPGTGMDVFMYVDSPGQFLTAHGNPVPDNIAANAGYDIEKLGKERLRRQRKAEANAIIDKELNNDSEVSEKDVKEFEGWKVVSIGLGRHNVKDPEGNVLNAMPLPKESAMKLFEAMSGYEKKPAGDKSSK